MLRIKSRGYKLCCFYAFTSVCGFRRSLYRKRCLALPPQRADGFFQPVPADVASGDVQQPQTRHGERRGEQLGEQPVAKSVAGEPQLGHAGLQLQCAEQRAEGRRGQTQTGGRHGRARFLHLAQPGDVVVLLWGGGGSSSNKLIEALMLQHLLIRDQHFSVNHQLILISAKKKKKTISDFYSRRSTLGYSGPGGRYNNNNSLTARL